MPKHAKAAPDWTSETGKAASRKAYTPVQLKGALVNGFMVEMVVRIADAEYISPRRVTR